MSLASPSRPRPRSHPHCRHRRCLVRRRSRCPSRRKRAFSARASGAKGGQPRPPNSSRRESRRRARQRWRRSPPGPRILQDRRGARTRGSRRRRRHRRQPQHVRPSPRSYRGRLRCRRHPRAKARRRSCPGPRRRSHPFQEHFPKAEALRSMPCSPAPDGSAGPRHRVAICPSGPLNLPAGPERRSRS